MHAGMIKSMRNMPVAHLAFVDDDQAAWQVEQVLILADQLDIFPFLTLRVNSLHPLDKPRVFFGQVAPEC